MEVSTRLMAVVVLSMSILSCTKKDDGPTHELERGWAPAGACRFTSTRADRVYCRTTGVQLLTNPHVYDGQLVIVKGYIVVGSQMTYLYLTRDAREGAELHAALHLDHNATVDGLRRRFPNSANEISGPVEVGGRFTLNRYDSTKKKFLLRTQAFGSLAEVSE